MAKIYLRRNITHEMDNADAKKIKDRWLNNDRGIIDFGEISFLINDITGITLDTDEFVYDLSKDSDRWIILDFEKELGQRSFSQYCLDKGYLFYEKDHHDPFVNRDTVGEYNDAKDKLKALQSMQERNYVKENQLHKEELKESNRKVCQPKSMTRERCVYCWPWSFSELARINGRNDIADKIALIRKQKGIEVEPEPEVFTENIV